MRGIRFATYNATKLLAQSMLRMNDAASQRPRADHLDHLRANLGVFVETRLPDVELGERADDSATAYEFIKSLTQFFGWRRLSDVRDEAQASLCHRREVVLIEVDRVHGESATLLAACPFVKTLRGLQRSSTTPTRQLVMGCLTVVPISIRRKHSRSDDC